MDDMKNLLVVLLVFVLLSNSCSFIDPLTKAQNLVQKGKYEEAVKVLEKEFKSKPNSLPVKSLLAHVYSDYGIAICRDQSKPPRLKFSLAKEQFAMALALDPYSKDAKDMYEMVEKIQASFRVNKVD